MKPLNPLYQIFLTALAMYREARGEGEDGMLAVGHVLKNRTGRTDLDKHWSSLWGVVEQLNAFTGFREMTLAELPGPDDQVFSRALGLAAQVWQDGPDPTGGALYYWNPATSPKDGWFATHIAADQSRHPQTVVIGRHTFYG